MLDDSVSRGPSTLSMRNPLLELPVQLYRLAKRSFIEYHAHASFKTRGASLIGIIGFPLFYVIWSVLLPQAYESFWLRLIGFLLCLAVFTFEYWPQWARRHHVIVAYITILYCVPFFFTYMLFMNGASTVWQLSAISGFIYMVMLCDIINAIVLCMTGSLLGYLLFVAMTGVLTVPTEYLTLLPVLAFVLSGVAFLNYSSHLVIREKMTAVGNIAAHIAHEMRTPLLGIKLDADRLAHVLPALLEAHEFARTQGWDGRVPRAQRDGLAPALDRILQHASSANVIIDMLLINAASGTRRAPLAPCSASAIVASALERYNFRAGQRELVHVVDRGDFRFMGSDILMVHVLFNLLKNALRAIEKAGKGEIVIELVPGARQNRIVFRDSGPGMPPDVARFIFVPFYTNEAIGVGTGMGLAFCSNVVESIGGTIDCRSSLGEGATFTITLPKVEPAEEEQTAGGAPADEVRPAA